MSLSGASPFLLVTISLCPGDGFPRQCHLESSTRCFGKYRLRWQDVAWCHSLPLSSIHKVGATVPVLSEWQEGRGQREREPPRLTYERSLLAERLEGPCSHPTRRHVGAEQAEESSAVVDVREAGAALSACQGPWSDPPQLTIHFHSQECSPPLMSCSCFDHFP